MEFWQAVSGASALLTALLSILVWQSDSKYSNDVTVRPSDRRTGIAYTHEFPRIRTIEDKH